MNPAKVIVEGIQVDPSKRANPKENGRSVDQSKADASKVEIINTSSFKAVFFYGAGNIEAK